MPPRIPRGTSDWKEGKLHGPGLLFVVSGPSGAGKDTLVASLRERMPELRYSVSATTRPPRPGEADGLSYHFFSPEQFREVAAQGGFLETKTYNGQFYGTPRSYVTRNLADGYDLIMKPDVDGALAVQRSFPQAALIFVLPDRFSYLRERLEARRTESNEEIAARLGIAHEEIAQVRAFDYLVINEQSNPTGAVDDLEAILHAERHRIHRYDDTTLRRLEHS